LAALFFTKGDNSDAATLFWEVSCVDGPFGARVDLRIW